MRGDVNNTAITLAGDSFATRPNTTRCCRLRRPCRSRPSTVPGISIDLPRVKELLAHPIVVDGRNMFDPQIMRAHGFVYYGTGRSPLAEVG